MCVFRVVFWTSLIFVRYESLSAACLRVESILLDDLNLVHVVNLSAGYYLATGDWRVDSGL